MTTIIIFAVVGLLFDLGLLYIIGSQLGDTLRHRYFSKEDLLMIAGYFIGVVANASVCSITLYYLF